MEIPILVHQREAIGAEMKKFLAFLLFAVFALSAAAPAYAYHHRRHHRYHEGRPIVVIGIR
jgi:hypothetical protein